MGSGDKNQKDAALKSGLEVYNNAKLPVWISDNVYFFGARPSLKDQNQVTDPDFDPEIRLEEKDGNGYIHLTLNQLFYDHKVRIINTDILGKAVIPRVKFDDPDGTALVIDRDYSGNIRTAENNLAGPFANIAGHKITIKVW